MWDVAKVQIWSFPLRLMLLFCLCLIFIGFICQSTLFFFPPPLSFSFSKSGNIIPLRAVWKTSAGTLKPARKTKATHSQWSVHTLQCTPDYSPSPRCRHNIFTPPLPSALCSADAHTGIGKAIVSNCNAQDFDYTPALEAQHCKRTIAPRATEQQEVQFQPLLNERTYQKVKGRNLYFNSISEVIKRRALNLLVY